MPEEEDRIRPSWWKGKDGNPPLMPATISGKRTVLNGMQLEEMIWNRDSNPAYDAPIADTYIGGGHAAALQRMRTWDQHKRDWLHTTREQVDQLGITHNQKPSWRRYHDFVEQGGDRTPHPSILVEHKPGPRKTGAITAMCA